MGLPGIFLKLDRTAAAFLLTTVAVAVPCGAWYLAGDRELERRVHLEEKGVYHKAYKKGVNVAERMATRLEELRRAESRRPFYHYQNLFHDPQGAAEGVAVSVSPLAHGSADPLIAAHFQVDEEGRLTLPTLNDEFPELGLENHQAEHCTLLSELSDVAVFCTLEPGMIFGEEKASLAGISKKVPEVSGAGGGVPLSPSREGYVEVLQGVAWDQHLRANTLYGDLKYGRSTPVREGLGTTEGTLEIMVSPLEWHTLPVGDEPRLVALRTVETPAGGWHQGFVVSHTATSQMLESSHFRATFKPTQASAWESRPDRTGPGFVVMAVAGTPWELTLDVSEPMNEARRQALLDRESFLRSFVLGALGAGLAGLLVVVMVYQSEKLARERAQFAAAAAHELRTPLAGMRLYGEMLAEGLGSPEGARRYARRLAAEAERLGRVVTNVLSFTRLERDSLGVKPQPGDLAAAVRGACERQRPALEENGASLELELEDDLPTVCFDHDAVIHVVQNLLDNAEKYTRDVNDRRIRVRLSRVEEGVELTISDHGHGIPETLQRRLFRPFARGQHPDASEGLGLGLVLVKALMKAQGGAVWYRDARSGGAAFVVSFPA
jgi:signal transduction histidine kinase